MSDSQTSLLKKKIECASFDISIYPRLDDLLAIIGKVFADGVSLQLQTSVMLKNTSANMRSDKNVLEGISEDSAFYWITDQHDDNTLLIILSPAFVGALSEALLGGEFLLATDTPSLTSLDRELTQSLIDEIRCLLNVHIGAESVDVEPAIFKSFRAVKSFKDVFRGQDTTAHFVVSVSLNINGISADNIVTCMFPIEFLECAGFLESKRSQSSANAENTQWFNTMRNNIMNSSIDLPVIFDRFTTTVGELSRLAVGQMLPVTPDAHQMLSIELALQNEVLQIAQGRLGTVKDSKAAKVTTISK